MFLSLAVLATLGLVVLSQQKANQRVLDFMDNALDSMNKLAQIGMIHAGSKNASEAVAVVAQTQLDLPAAENGLAAELEASKPKRLVGFISVDAVGNQRPFYFDKEPPPQMLAKIPEHLRIYKD